MSLVHVEGFTYKSVFLGYVMCDDAWEEEESGAMPQRVSPLIFNTSYQSVETAINQSSSRKERTTPLRLALAILISYEQYCLLGCNAV
jgi:hypothetical protein